MKISGLVIELEPFKDFILASEVEVDLGGQKLTSQVKGHFLEKLCNILKNIAEKV